MREPEKKGISMADSRREKVGGRPIRKRKSSSTATEILRNNRRGRERRSQKKGVRVGGGKTIKQEVGDTGNAKPI